MKRLVILLGLLVLSGLLAACSSGGDDDGEEVLPLEVQFVVASPNAGIEPLRAVLTTVITGGKAPFFYAWDFTNDGAVDFFDNAQYSRTANVAHDYYRRVADGADDSVFMSTLKVTDSEGTVVTPDPVPITVLAQGGTTPDANGTGWSTPDSLAHSGEPVFFSVAGTGGVEPYTYAWDFDNDGATDSTVRNPQHTFYYNGPEQSEEFVVGVTITDSKGQVFGTKDGLGAWKISPNVMYVRVWAPGSTIPVVSGYNITLNSDPVATPGTPYPTIELKYDPTQEEAGAVPLEPELDLSVVVDPFGGGGVQPFEYYWDFDNDGSIESQAPSPSVPFYDYSRKILVNTYVHNLDSKTFTLRCMVIDGTGRVENAYRTVVVQNTASSVDLVVVPQYGVLLGTGTDPFGAVVDSDGDKDYRDEVTTVNFNFSVTGSTGEYDYQFDANGDGTPEIPEAGGFEPVFGNQITIDATNLAPYQGVGYFPSKIIVRSLQSGAPAQIVTVNVPVSLVGRQSLAVEGDLEPRFGHSVESNWTTMAGGGNGVFLTARELMIVGGAVGNTPIGNVEKLVQEFPPGAPPAAEGDIEVAESMTAYDYKPLLIPRKGAMMWTEGTNYYFHGGEGENGVLQAFVEVFPVNGDENTPWAIINDLNGYFPLKYGMGTRVTDVDSSLNPYDMSGHSAADYDALVFCGGIYEVNGETPQTNGSIIIYRSLIWPDVDPMQNPNFDQYMNLHKPMMTPRHEGCLVWNPDNRMLYAIGGRTGSGTSTATVEVFDFEGSEGSQEWLNLPPMNNPRAGGVAKFIGGQIYIMGGSYYPEDESSRVVLTTAEVYDPITGIWSETVPPALPTHQPGAASLPGPGSVSDQGVDLNTIWYFGGSTDIGEQNSFEEFVYFHSVPLPAE